MAIGKVESAGAVVVVGRPVDPTELRRIARENAVHAGSEMAIVDALGALVGHWRRGNIFMNFVAAESRGSL